MVLTSARSVCLKTVGRPGNKNFVGLLTVMALVSALGVMFSAACGQGRSSSGSAIFAAAQKQRVESLYASEDEALSRHDIAKIVSFFDPTYVFVAADGKRTSYAEWRQNLPASLAPARHSQVRTRVKAVQGVENGFVASIEWQHSYDIYDSKRAAWTPMIVVATQEETWRSDARGNWRTVLTKTLREERWPAAQKQRVEPPYASEDEAYSRHDIAKIVSFLDPTYVFVAADGKRTSYTEWRRNLPASLAPARHSQVRTTVKAVQGVENGFLASIEWQHSYDIYDAKRAAWIPMIVVATQEETWRSDARGNWKIVLTKSLREETSPVVVRSGGYPLTEAMIQRALLFGQILAGADFSPSDAASLRADLIAYFREEPAKQVQAHESIAQAMQGIGAGRKPSGLDLAGLRYTVWQGFAEDPLGFRVWQSYPFGRMVLKYNPVLVNSGGMIITRRDVDWQFTSDEMVAKIAGVSPPTQADKEQYVRSLPAKFASLPKDQQEDLRASQVRFANVHGDIDGTIKTRAAVEADIRNTVHSSRDVWREARQVENDSTPYSGKYYYLWHNEMWGAFFQAQRVNNAIQGIGRANENVMRKSQLPQLLPNGAPAH